jgi:branched-chain amino acid transport system substrate-binding protein
MTSFLPLELRGLKMIVRRRVVATIAAFFGLSALALTSCNERGGDSAAPIPIGVLTPLTGSDAAYGAATRKGVDLAAAEINAAGGIGGRPIRIVYVDDRMSPTEGVTAFQQLLAAEHPPVVIGPFGSSVVLAVAPIANSARVPIISASATGDSIADAGDYVFRITPPNSRQGADDAAYSYNRLGARRAMIVFQNNEYGTTLRDAFARRFQELGGQIVGVEGADVGSTDFRPSLRKALSLRPDVIFFPLHSQDATLFLRQAREQGVTGSFISADGAMTNELVAGAGPAANGVYFSTLALGFGVADRQIDAFRRAHAARYGAGEPDVYSAYYYEVTMIVAQALRNGTSPENVRVALNRMNGRNAFSGITGTTSFDSRGEVDKPFYVYRVVNGSFRLAPR